MADLIREEDMLVLGLSTLEKIEGVHGDIRVPISSVQSVKVLEDVIDAVHGIKMPGSRIPGVFAMVHHQTKRGLKINLSGAAYDALIVSEDHPEELIDSLGLSRN